MPSLVTQLAPILQGSPGWALLLGLLVVSLVLIFAGRSMIKVIVFLIAGLLGAGIGGTLGAQFLGASGNLIGIVVGFLLGGLAGVALLGLGIGLALGYGAYLLVLDLGGSSTVALIAGFVFFIIGLALSGKILSIVTAIAGGVILYDVLRILGLDVLPATAIAALVAIVGIWFQNSRAKKALKPAQSSQPAPTQPGTPAK